MSEFELWFKGRYGFAPERLGDGYADVEINGMWARWQRAAVKPII